MVVLVPSHPHQDLAVALIESSDHVAREEAKAGESGISWSYKMATTRNVRIYFLVRPKE